MRPSTGPSSERPTGGDSGASGATCSCCACCAVGCQGPFSRDGANRNMHEAPIAVAPTCSAAAPSAPSAPAHDNMNGKWDDERATVAAEGARAEAGRGLSSERGGAELFSLRNLNKSSGGGGGADSRTMMPARRRRQPGRSSATVRIPSFPMVMAAMLMLISLTSLLPPSVAAEEAHAAAAAAAAEATAPLPTSRKRPRRQKQSERRTTGQEVVTGDISQIILMRGHPHPEPTPSPTFFYDDETIGGNGLPQPRNERPWEEEEEVPKEEEGGGGGGLQLGGNSTDEMEGRDGEEADGDDTEESVDEGDDDGEDNGEDNKLVPDSDDGGTIDLLEELDEEDANNDEDNNNNAEDGKIETIDVTPGEYAAPVFLTPAPVVAPPPTTAKPTTASPTTTSPTTTSPTAAPVTPPPTTAEPTGAPSREPSPAPTTANPTPAPSLQPVTAAPVTNAPSRQPQTAPTTEYPTPSPTKVPTVMPATAGPTLPPSTAKPTLPPVLEPTATPTSQPTPPPSSSPTPAPTLPIQEFLVELEFVFDDLSKLEDSSIILWEEVTAEQIYDHMYWSSSEIGMEEFLGMGVNTRIRRQIQGAPAAVGPGQPQPSGGTGQVASDRADKGGGRRSRRLRQKRMLQASGGDESRTPTPLTIISVNVIKFRSTREYTEDYIEDIVGKAFNSESDREKYIQELKVTNDRSFRNINSVTVIMDGSPVPEAPTPAPVPSPGDGNGDGGGINIWLIVGPLIGGVLVVVAFGILFYSKQQSKRKRAFMSKAYDATRVSKFVDVNQCDDVSTLGDPFPGGGAMFAASPLVKDTADNSVSHMSADYDYARAFGTRGDAPTASTPKSFEADRSQGSGSGRATLSTVTGGFAAKMDASLFQDDASFEKQYCEQEERIEINAPAGKLGVVIDTPVGGVPVVHAIKDTSILVDKVRVGDQLVSVDDVDTTQLSAIEVSKLISSRANNRSRVLVFIRLHVGDQ